MDHINNAASSTCFNANCCEMCGNMIKNQLGNAHCGFITHPPTDFRQLPIYSTHVDFFQGGPR